MTKVVMVHGIFNNGSIFWFMRRCLQRQGFDCLVPVLKPSDGRRGMADPAEKLKQQIDSHWGESDKFTLIGFSMGGIVARYYLQKLEGVERVDRFFAISTPHNGSYLSYVYPGKGTRQLRPGSELLADLRANENTLSTIPLYSYWTPLDLSIIPSSSSSWSIAVNRRFKAPVHALMLFHKNVIDTIVSECQTGR